MIKKGDIVTDMNGIISLAIETTDGSIELLCIQQMGEKFDKVTKLAVIDYINTEKWINDHVYDIGDATIHGNIGDLLMIFKEALDEANGVPEKR